MDKGQVAQLQGSVRNIKGWHYLSVPVEAKKGRNRSYNTNLHSYEADQERQHDVPLVQQQADVHAGTRGHKEQTQQHPSEWPNVSLDLCKQSALVSSLSKHSGTKNVYVS